MRNRKGYTLIELVVALVVLLLVTGSLYKLLVSTQRLSRAQAERVDLQSNVRTASLVIPAELRELNTVVGGTVQNDIFVKNATSIRYRAMRGIGFICQVPTTTGEIRILKSTWSGLRDPVGVRDAGFVFYDGANPDVSSDDVWLQVSITNVTNSTCGTEPAFSLTISPAVLELTSLPVRTPVRVFEVMELSLYPSGGQSWLGAQSISGGELAPQPLLGPLVPTAGLESGLLLEYLDNANNPAAAAGDVKSIKLTVVGLTNQAIAKHGGSSQTSVVRDTLVTRVSLRNAFRP